MVVKTFCAAARRLDGERCSLERGHFPGTLHEWPALRVVELPIGPVCIRVWDGCRVVALMSVDRSGTSSFSGAASGAANSSRVDIELDPWANLIVDHRAQHPVPVSTRERTEVSDDQLDD